MHILVVMKGTYLLVMKLPKDAKIRIGKQGIRDFKNGCYVYVGSALNGLEKRIQRHLRLEKKTQWHIDYLRPYTEVSDIFYKENTIKEECRIAQVFERQFNGIPGFGCCDCSCKSHLFYGASQEIGRLAGAFEMKPFRF